MGASDARRLARTESNYVANQAEMDSYAECGVEKYEFVATLDVRTSDVCAALDGKVFPVKEQQPGVNAPPMHPYCRSTTIAYFDDDVMEGLQRRARDPETGKTYLVPADMTYPEWKKSVEKVVVAKAGESGKIEAYRSKGIPTQENKAISPDVEKSVQMATQKVTRDFKVLETYSEPIVFGDTDDSLAQNKFDPRTGKNQITLNESAFSDKLSLLETLQHDFESGESYDTDKIESLVAHEMGHNAHVALTLKRTGISYGKPLTLIEASLFAREYSKITQEIYLAAFTNESRAEIISMCSRELGAKAILPKELIAQSFGNYYFGKNKSSIAKSIVKYFKKGLK